MKEAKTVERLEFSVSQQEQTGTNTIKRFK